MMERLILKSDVKKQAVALCQTAYLYRKKCKKTPDPFEQLGALKDYSSENIRFKKLVNQVRSMNESHKEN